jgi:hypothetical protein
MHEPAADRQAKPTTSQHIQLNRGLRSRFVAADRVTIPGDPLPFASGAAVSGQGATAAQALLQHCANSVISLVQPAACLAALAAGLDNLLLHS